MHHFIFVIYRTQRDSLTAKAEESKLITVIFHFILLTSVEKLQEKK